MKFKDCLIDNRVKTHLWSGSDKNQQRELKVLLNQSNLVTACFTTADLLGYGSRFRGF